MKFKMLPLNQLKQDSHDCDDAFHRRALSFYFQPEIQAPCIILLPFLCRSVHKIQARHTGLHNAWFSCSCLSTFYFYFGKSVTGFDHSLLYFKWFLLKLPLSLLLLVFYTFTFTHSHTQGHTLKNKPAGPESF